MLTFHALWIAANMDLIWCFPFWWYTSRYLGVCRQVWREYNKAHKNWKKHQRLIRKALRHYKQDLRFIKNALKHQKTSQELHMGYSLW